MSLRCWLGLCHTSKNYRLGVFCDEGCYLLPAMLRSCKCHNLMHAVDCSTDSFTLRMPCCKRRGAGLWSAVTQCAGSQLPLAMPRSDARQNLIDSMTCATAFFTPPHVLLQEVAICFGGRLMRGNRTQKVIACTHRVCNQIPTLYCLKATFQASLLLSG